jgi:predicted nucleotidyltransferase
MTDYKALLAALGKEGVEFILVGGLAATAHGSGRFTEDVDIVYRRTADNHRRLVAALSPLAPYLREAPPGLPFNWNVPTIERGLNFTLETSAGAIDLFGEITGGGSYDAILPYTIAITVFGTACRCIDLPHLIQVKRAAGRPKDLEIIAELEALLEERDEG